MPPAIDRIPPSFRTKRGNGASIACVVLGGWLFLWALFLPQGTVERTSTLIFGGLIALASAVAVQVPSVAWVSRLLAALLFADTIFLMRDMPGVAWHNAVVAAAIFVLSLISGRTQAKMRR